MSDIYAQGFAAFDSSNPMDPIELKKKPYLFREGYKTAEQEYLSNKCSYRIELKLEEVSRNKVRYVPTYDDILTITMRPRTAVLNRKPELQPLLSLLIRKVEEHADQIHTFTDMVRMVNKGFDIYLQYGYDQGILNENDLLKYDYKPTQYNQK